MKASNTCERVVGVLADVVDGTLTGPVREDMLAHAAACPSCGPLLDQARKGRAWLAEIEDVEPPASLVHNILAATTFAPRTVAAPAPGPVPSSLAAAWASVLAFVRQPRLVLTSAMAFFSLSMIANVTGAGIDDLRVLRPSTISRKLSLEYHETTAGVARYYENNRFLRELQDTLQVLRDVVSEPVDDVREESHNNG